MKNPAVSLVRLQKIFEFLPDSKKNGAPDFPSVLSNADLQSERYGSLHHYLHSTKPFEYYAEDHRVQLIQQLEFVLDFHQDHSEMYPVGLWRGSMPCCAGCLF